MKDLNDLTLMPLADLQLFFDSLYGARNKERFGSEIGRGLSSMWLEIVQHAGNVAKGIRKEDDELVLRSLPKLFCWYSGFCTKCRFSMEDMLWRWFPAICPTCYESVCECGREKSVGAKVRQKDPVLLARWYQLNDAKRPRTLDEYVEMFRGIYGHSDNAGKISDIFLHLMEELGEVAERIQQIKHAHDEHEWLLIARELESELADVFSWIAKLAFRTADKLYGVQRYLTMTDSSSYPVSGQKITLSKALLLMYRSGCPDCGGFPCIRECPGWIGTIPRG